MSFQVPSNSGRYDMETISCSFSGQDVISGEKEKLETFPEEK